MTLVLRRLTPALNPNNILEILGNLDFLEIMKLTRRQEEFIKKTVEMRDEFQGPIHYSQIAERLGVSPFTAYDMLRVLEKKGFVTSEYQLAADKSGPGRAERLFYPTPLAIEGHRQVSQSAQEALSLEGEALKQFLLQKFESGELPTDSSYLEILARIPPIDQSQISYCLEVITVMALNLRYHGKYQVLADHLAHILPENGQANRANLCLLVGFSLGILVEVDANDPEWTQILYEHINRYVEVVLTLNDTECRELNGHLTQLFKSLSDDQFFS